MFAHALSKVCQQRNQLRRVPHGSASRDFWGDLCPFERADASSEPGSSEATEPELPELPQARNSKHNTLPAHLSQALPQSCSLLQVEASLPSSPFLAVGQVRALQLLLWSRLP